MEQNYSNPERSLPGDTDSDFQLSQELNKSTDDRFNLSSSFRNKGKERHHQEQLNSPEKYALETLRMTPTQFERYRNAFGLFDLSDTGKISKVEFERVIGFFELAKDISQRELTENFLLLDRNNDRHFTIFDFLRETNNQNMFRFLVRIVKTVLAKEEEIRAYKNESSSAARGLSEIREQEEIPKAESDEFSYEPLLSNPKAYASSILKMDDNEFDRCKQAFEMLDLKNEGYVTKDRFSEHLTYYHFGKDLSKAEYNYMFSKIESELNGEFNFLDFLKVMKKDPHGLFRKLVDHLNKRLEPFESIKSYDMKENLVHEDEKEALHYAKNVLKMEEGYMNRLIRLFRALDMSQQSFISLEDFDAVLMNTSLNKALSLNEFQDLFRELDLDRDGKITLKDFFMSIHEDNFSTKSTDFLNEIFSHFDKSLKLERKRAEVFVVEPEVEADQLERRREELVEVEPEAELEVEIMREAEMEEKNEGRKLEGAGALNEELHRRLLTVDHDISVFNEHIERDLRVVEEGYKADLELLKSNLIQKEQLLKEKDLLIETLRKENNEFKINNQSLARMRQYEEEIAAMQKAHDLFMKDRNQEVIKIQQLQEEISNLLKDNEQKTNEIERLDQEIGNWKRMASEKSGSVDLINNIESLNNQIQDLIREKNEIEEERRVLMVRSESLEKERTQLYEDLSEVKKDIEIVYKDEDERRHQIEELCKQVQSSVSVDQYNALLKERDTLANEMKSFRSGREEKEALETRIRELETDRNQLRETCDKVNQDLQMIVSDIDNFEQREKGYLSQIEDLNRQVGGMDRLRKEINDLREENDMLSSRVEQLQQVATNETHQERLRSQGLVQELNEFEGNLKRLQQREDEYNKQIGALSEDLGKYTIDTEKLRLDNSILQDQVASLNEEVSQTRAKLAQMHDINKRLTNEYSSMNVELSRLREAKNKSALEIDALVNSEHRLKEDLEKIKLEFQSLKIRNLVLEDKVEILDKERGRLDELNKRLGQKHLLDFTTAENETDQLKRQIRELKTDNIHLREQIDQMRAEKYGGKATTPSKPSSGRILREREQQQDKENMTPNRGTYQDKGYLGAIEKLKDELKHVRESREAILDSLEKERVSIRDAIEDSTRARLSFSNRKTPLKEQEKEFAPTATQEHPHEPTARKSGFIHLTTHSAPETIKKTGVRQMPSLSDQKDSSRKSSVEFTERGGKRNV